ncbi:MAG: hypothetical protein ACOCXN_02860 [Spirochaetota bacterium]
MNDDAALGWYREAEMLKIEQTPSTSPRTIGSPLFPVNYLDRMIRHRVKEHPRESIRRVRRSQLQTPPVRWRKPQKVSGPVSSWSPHPDLGVEWSEEHTR